MKAKVTILLSIIALMACCQKEVIQFGPNDLVVKIEAGDGWIHDFPLFLRINLKNPPQFAVWLTDLDTNYVGTIFCTSKIAREGWVSNRGNRRKEALPYWCHCRGITYPDGLMLPTREDPLTDGLTGATPKADYFVRISPRQNQSYLIFAEFNHSVDFNETYRNDAKEGSPTYSGGKEGSGQPALVYSARIDLAGEAQRWELQLLGHSSPDGSTGIIYHDLSAITTARSIVRRVAVERQ